MIVGCTLDILLQCLQRRHTTCKSLWPSGKERLFSKCPKVMCRLVAALCSWSELPAGVTRSTKSTKERWHLSRWNLSIIIHHHSIVLSINSIDLIDLIELLGVPLCSVLAVLGPSISGNSTICSSRSCHHQLVPPASCHGLTFVLFFGFVCMI